MQVIYVGEGKVVKFTGKGDYLAIYIGRDPRMQKLIGKTVYVIVIGEYERH